LRGWLISACRAAVAAYSARCCSSMPPRSLTPPTFALRLRFTAREREHCLWDFWSRHVVEHEALPG
jgi:hypothetical protein